VSGRKPRAEYALRFRPLTTELQTALRRRGIESGPELRKLAEEVGIARATLWAIRSGRSIPIPATVALLADVLAWPRLASVSTELRTRECGVCGQTFVDSTLHFARLYCREECRKTGATRSRRGLTQEQRTVSERRLVLHQRAVADFCRTCVVGTGVCSNASCELRPVSPYPLPKGEQWAEIRRRRGIG
jgi:DNA-binding XRE family transcriptional regulator